MKELILPNTFCSQSGMHYRITAVPLLIFIQLQLFLSYLFIAESYQSENPINVMLMMSFLFYCGAVFMEVYLLSIVCWGASSEVH